MAKSIDPKELYDVKINSPQQGGYAYNIIEGKVRTPDGVFMVTFYRHPTGRGDWGTEVYTGENYIVGSKKKSWSRNFHHWASLPDKWVAIAMALERKHKEVFGLNPDLIA